MKTSRKTRVALILAVLMGLVLLSLGCQARAPAQGSPAGATLAPVYKWRMQSTHTLGDIGHTTILPAFIENVKKMSKGLVDIKLFEVGALSDAPEMPDALSKGVLDLGLSNGPDWAGVIPLAKLEFTIPNDPRSPAELEHFYYDRGGINLLREIYAKHNVRYVAVYLLPYGYQLLSKIPVKSLSDLKGAKIRSYGVIQDVVKKIGGTPIYIKGPEIYMAAQTGTIEGIIYGSSEEYVYNKFYEVAKYLVFPYVGGPQTESFMVNMDVWKKLPVDIQTMLEVAMREADWYRIRLGVINEAEAIRTMQKNFGVTVVELSASDKAKLVSDASAILNEYAAQDADSKRYVDLTLNHLRELGYLK